MKINLGWEIEFLAPSDRFGLRKDLHASMGYKFCVPPTHDSGYRDHWNNWHLKNDRSIRRTTKKHDNLIGHELISPVLPYDQSIEELRKVFGWIHERGFSTNVSTGLHVNFSVNNAPESIKFIDKLKLIMLVDEFGILAETNRLSNRYCCPHRVALVATCLNLGKKPSELDRKTLENLVDFNKYRTINFNKLANGYLEFRMLGGTHYHLKYDQNLIRIEQFKKAFEDSMHVDSSKIAFEFYFAKWLEYCNKLAKSPVIKYPNSAYVDPYREETRSYVDIGQIGMLEEELNALRKGEVYVSNPVYNVAQEYFDEDTFCRWLDGVIEESESNIKEKKNIERLTERFSWKTKLEIQKKKEQAIRNTYESKKTSPGWTPGVKLSEVIAVSDRLQYPKKKKKVTPAISAPAYRLSDPYGLVNPIPEEMNTGEAIVQTAATNDPSLSAFERYFASSTLAPRSTYEKVNKKIEGPFPTSYDQLSTYYDSYENITPVRPDGHTIDRLKIWFQDISYEQERTIESLQPPRKKHKLKPKYATNTIEFADPAQTQLYGAGSLPATNDDAPSESMYDSDFDFDSDSSLI